MTRPADPSATPAPSRTPATTSENQCAFRYTLDSAITNANPIATNSHRRRAGPAGRSTSTRATAVAAPATACPDGNENPTTSTSGSGGRPRWKNVLAAVRISSAAAHVITHVANARHRLRNASQTATAIRSGIVTIPPPRTLRKRASRVRTPLRMSSIQW